MKRDIENDKFGPENVKNLVHTDANEARGVITK